MRLIKYLSCKLFVIVILINACSPKQDKIENKTETLSTVAATIETGKPLDKIYCNNSSINSYALYLPRDYSRDKSWPVIFFFDPHASGKLPVKQYYALAEKYGYVICCSNNSKNGLDIATIKTMATEMMNDVFQKFSFDSNRVYAGGFSGGARVAATLAMSNNIAGLICCGAGIQPDMTFVNSKINYIGIAGKSDFSYIELNLADQQLDATQKTGHDLLIFDGKHEWPPIETMKKAFLLLDFYAMNNHLLKEDKDVIDAITQQIKDMEDSLKFKQAMSQKKEQFVKEFNLQQKYMAAIPEKDLNWWKTEISKMKILADQRKEEAYTYKRLLAYLSLGTYMYSNDALSKNNFKMAETFITLYELVDPDNSEHAYMRAIMCAQTGNEKEVFSFLQ